MKPTQRQIDLFSYNLELGFGDREVARQMEALLAPILPGEITEALKVCFDQVEIGPLSDDNQLRDLLKVPGWSPDYSGPGFPVGDKT